MAGNNIKYAGDYNAEDIVLISTSGTKETTLDISSMVIELNVYESIYKQALTGSVVIIDAVDLGSKVRLTGNERISFKMSTPKGAVDASTETGHPMHIYKMTDKKQVKENVQRYVLHFCSREMLRSIRTRVVTAITGPIDEIVQDIFADINGLDSRKTLNFEPCRNGDKYTFPSMRPLDAISMLANKALSLHGKSAGYYFYETTQGYYFRSYENMVAINSRLARPAVVKYDYKVRKTQVGNRASDNPNSAASGKISSDLNSVESFEFINNYDSAAHQATGTYASHMIMYDFFNKTYQEVNFDYHDNYEDQIHTDSFKNDKTRDYNKFPISAAPIDYDQNSVSDYPMSRISLIPTSRFIHGEDTGIFGVALESDGLLEAKRVSQQNSVANGVTLRLTVPGQCHLTAGDVIDFDLRTVQKQRIPSGDDPRDINFAGRYLITTLRHKFNQNTYQCVMECTKDSLYIGLPDDTNVAFPPEKSSFHPLHGAYSSGSNTEANFNDLSDEDAADNQDSYRGRY